ncbi:MAG TPA: Mth938-like domain-containing protein [Stellaceae bacterium]|nr:Mth938-like domain-containing protein [Stellaceae bacterium]
MDITPVIPAGRQIVERYGSGGFRISGVDYSGSVLVFPTETLGWDVADFAEVTSESLGAVRDRGSIEILLLGCGRRMLPVPKAIRAELKQAGMTVDAMDTGAACRTYNVLIGEGRLVAAALLLPR